MTPITNNPTTAYIPATPTESLNNALPKNTSQAIHPTPDTSSNTTHLEHYSNAMIAKKILTYFTDLEAPNSKTPNSFHLSDLRKMAAGKLHDGRDATREQIEVAKEFFKRPGLIGVPKTYPAGWVSENISWNELARVAGDFKSLSDKHLLHQLEIYFREFAEGANDEYVNINELREAAREIRSTRDFSYNATAVARELLNRPNLLHKLDTSLEKYIQRPSSSRPTDVIPVRSKQDGRFNLIHIFYTSVAASSSPHRPA